MLPTFLVCSRYDPMYGGAARAPPSTYTGSDYGTYNRAPSRGAFIPPPPLSGMYNLAPSRGGVHPSAPSLRYVQPSSVPGAFIPPPPLSGMYNQALSRGAFIPPPLSQVCTTKLRPGWLSSLRPLSQVHDRASYQTIKIYML